jgi:hypothetical protein
MQIKEILREYNEQRLINDFGKKLSAKYESEFHKKVNVNDIVKQIASLDPTGNKELTFWLVNNYANNRINRFEDIASRAIPELLKFKALLKKPNLNPPLQVRDINQIKGLTSLEELLDQYSEKEAISNKDKDEEIEQEFYKTNQAEVLYNDKQVKVIIPKTEKASCFFGIGTKWCTAAKNGNVFSKYYKDNDPLYIIIIKGTNEKYQFHFGTTQFMNSKDEEINPQDIANKYPVLWEIFEPISRKFKSIILIKNPSEADQLAAVQEYGRAIQLIKNPTEKVQLAAVQQDGYAIQYIKNPSEAVQLAAVQQDGSAIQLIKNPSEAVQLIVVQENGYTIEFIKNPTETVQLAALQQYGYAIQYIKNPTEKVQLAAVQKYGNAIDYIKNPSEKIQLAAVQKIGNAIAYIKNPSEAVQLAAVQQDGYAIGYIKNPSETVQLAAVQQDGNAIQFIKNPTEKVKQAANKNRDI